MVSGIITTFRAIHCFIAILTAHPEVQTTLQAEVDQVVGDREPRLSDKQNMPYTDAVSLLLVCDVWVHTREVK